MQQELVNEKLQQELKLGAFWFCYTSAFFQQFSNLAYDFYIIPHRSVTFSTKKNGPEQKMLIIWSQVC